MEYFDKVTAFCKEAFGTNSVEYAQILDDLAITYENMGNLIKSLQLNRESIAIRKKVMSSIYN